MLPNLYIRRKTLFKIGINEFLPADKQVQNILMVNKGAKNVKGQKTRNKNMYVEETQP
jgi:hypothetical protein